MNAGKQLVDGDRQEQLGDPVPNMERFAGLIEAYLGVPVTSHDAAMIELLLKVSRAKANPTLRDNYDDIEGYCEIARRCAGVTSTEAGEARQRLEDMT